MGDKNNVDTTSFRRAIWNYIHSLFGIRHDDYDYSVINKLLERPLKAYVKIVTCFPERVMHADYSAFMRDFNHSEKVCRACYQLLCPTSLFVLCYIINFHALCLAYHILIRIDLQVN